MTGPGDDARNPHQPPWEPPPADYPPDYPPLYPPYPPYPPYPTPQFGPPPPAGAYYPPPIPSYPAPIPSPGTNGLAIASLVTAFAGFLCCLGSMVAIVLGAIALDQIKRTRQQGFGLAVAGIVLGVAGLIVALVIWIFAMQYR